MQENSGQRLLTCSPGTCRLSAMSHLALAVFKPSLAHRQALNRQSMIWQLAGVLSQLQQGGLLELRRCKAHQQTERASMLSLTALKTVMSVLI